MLAVLTFHTEATRPARVRSNARRIALLECSIPVFQQKRPTPVAIERRSLDACIIGSEARLDFCNIDIVDAVVDKREITTVRWTFYFGHATFSFTRKKVGRSLVAICGCMGFCGRVTQIVFVALRAVVQVQLCFGTVLKLTNRYGCFFSLSVRVSVRCTCVCGVCCESIACVVLYACVFLHMHLLFVQMSFVCVTIAI